MNIEEIRPGSQVVLTHPAWNSVYRGVVLNKTEYAVLVMCDNGYPAKVHPSVVHVDPDSPIVGPR